MSVFHPANVTSDGWEAPQTPQSHSPAINSCATDLIPRPSVPKSQVEVGWGCILSCMRTCCIGCISYVYSPLASSRLACQDIQRIQHIQPIQPYSHTRHTSYSAIQPPSGKDSTTGVAARPLALAIARGAGGSPTPPRGPAQRPPNQIRGPLSGTGPFNMDPLETVPRTWPYNIHIDGHDPLEPSRLGSSSHSEITRHATTCAADLPSADDRCA